MATELAKAYVQIIPSAKGIEGSIANALSGEGDKAGESVGQSFAASFGNIAKKAIVALGLGKVISDAIGDTSEFETSMAKVSTLFSGTGEEFAALQGSILDLSSSYGVAATTLAEAAYSAESASVPMEDLTAMLESSAKLAVAGFTDIDTALSATAKTMNAYGITGEEAMDKVQKVLMNTQNLGITTVGELGASLANVTPTAAAMGVSFEQVGAAMAQMTAQGVPTAQATTQLRSAMTELGKAGTKADEAFRNAAKNTEYAGMSFQEAMSAGADLGDVFGLMQAYADSTGQSMVDLWGSVEAGNAAMMIASDVEAFSSNLEAMGTDADVVGEAYGKMADTFGNSMDRLKESAKNFMITLFEGGDIGSSFDNMLSSLGDISDKLITWLTTGITGLAENLPELMESLLDFGGSILQSLGKVDWIQIGTTIITGIIESLGTLGQRLIELVDTAIKGLTGDGGVQFVEIGEMILDGATSVLGTLGETLSELFSSALDVLTGDNSLLSSFSSIGQSILDAVSGVLSPDGNNFLSAIFSSAESDISGIEWEKLGENVAKAGTAMVNLSGEVLAGGFTAAYKLIDEIKWDELGIMVGSVANGLISLTGETLSAAFTAAESTIKEIKWDKLGETVGTVANSLVDLTGETLAGAFTAAESIINGIGWEALGTTVASAANGLIGLTDNALSGAFTAAHATIDAIDWEGLGTTIGNVANGLVQYTGEALAAPFEAAFGILQGIKWEEVGAAIQSGIGDVWSGFTGLLGGLLGGVGDAAAGIGSGIGTAAEGIGQAIAKLFNGDDAKQAAEDLRTAMSDLEQAITDGKNTLETAAKGISSGIYTNLKEDLSPANMNDIGEKIITGIEGGIALETQNLTKKVTDIKDTFIGEDGYWTGVGETITGDVTTGIFSKIEDLSKAVETAKSGIKIALEGVEDYWSTVGGNIVSGIISGINSNASSLYTTMRNLAYNALNAAQKALGIASPSKVMEEQVGKWIPAGIAAGIVKNEDAVVSAMAGINANLAGAAVGSGVSIGTYAGSGSGSSDVVAAIQGLRNDMLNLKLLVGEKVFGKAVVDYGGQQMMDYIGEAESSAAYGYGT